MNINIDNFNLDFYLFMNDNIDNEKITNKESAYQDYLKNKENRIVDYDKKILENFNSIIYLLCNKDLRKLNIQNADFAKYHYIKYGKKENRISSINEVKKILKDFNWIEYVYLNKKLLHKLNNEKDCIIHYLLHGIKKNKPYKSDKIICTEFNWVIYVNYYYDLNFMTTKEKAFEHYINVGIDENRSEWICLQNILQNIDEEKYKKYNPDLKSFSKNELINHWLKKDKEERILIIKNNDLDINKEFGISISVYSDNNTPKERLYASYKCLNYLFLTVQTCKIYIIIDGNIIDEHFEFIKKLKNFYKNCILYKNKKNYGISITKNICLKILNDNTDLKYFCLLDDDIFIKNNFIDYSIDIIDNNDIPILTNFNKGLPYFENQLEHKYFVKSNFFFGNILVFSKKYFDIFGYFREFPYRWGEEHQEFTKRYLRNSNYENITIDFRNYLNDEYIVGNVSTLHLHSCIVDHQKVKLNQQKYNEYIKIQEYVEFDFNKYEVEEIK